MVIFQELNDFLWIIIGSFQEVNQFSIILKQISYVL